MPRAVYDAGTVVALLVAASGLARLRPVRWLFRQLVGDPVTRWATRIAVDANSTVHAKVEDLQRALDEHSAYTRHHLGPNGNDPPLIERITRVENAIRVPPSE